MVYCIHNSLTKHVSALTAAIFRVMFQPVYHTVNKSPTASSNLYTTPAHHLQLVPICIQHRQHITYNLFQSVHHTVNTSSTASSKRYITTPSAHHLQLVPICITHRQHITYN